VDAQPVVRDPDRPSPEPSDYSLVVEHLSFRYAMDEPPALVDVSFELPQGQHLAIVGPSGSGKTTLVNLLLRFWEYQEGYIGLGGHDLRSYRAEDVRRMIAVVTQHTYLFGGTLRDNLRVAHPDATEADLLRALEQAQLREFSQALPEGLDTWIGEQGVRLSAGERQRLAIARALLRNAPLLILDEATANLDALTEQQVFTSLEQLMLGRTTLLITHRLVGLERMDRILVLRAGRAVEQGRHDQLLQADTLYRRMWEVQRQAFDR
jgi:ATP-binding cassette subfamily C protein CydC